MRLVWGDCNLVLLKKVENSLLNYFSVLCENRDIFWGRFGKIKTIGPRQDGQEGIRSRQNEEVQQTRNRHLRQSVLGGKRSLGKRQKAAWRDGETERQWQEDTETHPQNLRSSISWAGFRFQFKKKWSTENELKERTMLWGLRQDTVNGKRWFCHKIKLCHRMSQKIAFSVIQLRKCN